MPEKNSDIGKQLSLPGEGFAPLPMVVSASRRTEVVALRPQWLIQALERFPHRFKKDIHSVVLWTKDPTNIVEHPGLRQTLSKYNLLVHFTITGLGGTRVEPTVPQLDVLLGRLPRLVEFLGDPRRLRWRFDPIVTLRKENNSLWSSTEYFENLAEKMVNVGVNNCYFSFCRIYQRKFTLRKLEAAGIHVVEPDLKTRLETVEKMKKITQPLRLILYHCDEPLLANVSGVEAARCIDARLLTELHLLHFPADSNQDKTMAQFRQACYCTESRGIGGYLPCSYGCAYCYAEAAVPSPDKLKLKPLPWETDLKF